MFCTGTMGELAPVIEVDGRTIGSGRVGPVTRRLSELYAGETATVGYPILENGGSAEDDEAGDAEGDAEADEARS